jgi:hypothetical protein
MLQLWHNLKLMHFFLRLCNLITISLEFKANITGMSFILPSSSNGATCDNFMCFLFNIKPPGRVRSPCEPTQEGCRTVLEVGKFHIRKHFRWHTWPVTCLRGSLSTGIVSENTVHSLWLPLLTYILLPTGALRLRFIYDTEQTTYFETMWHELYTHIFKETHQYSTSTFTSITGT